MKILFPILFSLLLLSCGEEKTNSKWHHQEGSGMETAQAFTEPAAVKPLTYEQRQGKHLYVRYCVRCVTVKKAKATASMLSIQHSSGYSELMLTAAALLWAAKVPKVVYHLL